MFAKLKKKIQDEGGISSGESADKQLPAAIDDGMSTTKSQNLSYVHNSDYQSHKRTNSSSVDSEQTNREKSSLGEKPHLATSSEPMDAASREELADLLMRRTHQVKTFEVKLSEMTLLLREKNQQIEKLEAELEKQQDSLCQRLQDLNEQYHSSRARLSESISSAVKKREEELHLEIQELEKAKTQLEGRLVVVEMEKDQFLRKMEESQALEMTAQEERSTLKSLLLDAQTEVVDYKKILSEKSSDRIEMKDLLHQISMLTEQTNAAERERQSSEDVVASLRASNERLEKLLKESTSAYAQMALQNSQDDWLEKQIESEREITRLEREIIHFKTELSLKVNQLNEMSKRLSDFQSQVNPLEAKFKTQTLRIQELEQLCEKTNSQLTDALKDKESFRQRSDELARLCDSLRQSHSESEAKLDSTVKKKEEIISALERHLSDEQIALKATQQKLCELQELKSVEHRVFETEEIARLQEELTETQLSLQEKLKIIKKQDQRLMDLKKLLQRELRVTSANSSSSSDQLMLANGSSGVPSAADYSLVQQAFDSADVHHGQQQQAAPPVLIHPAVLGPGAAAATLPISHSFTHSNARNTKLFAEDLQNAPKKDFLSGGGGGSSGALQRFNPQGIEDDDGQYDFTRELNFKYLRHVVLKFMLSRETEAIQLIKAVSMLLNFTKEEQKLIKDTLEWKMSWFGSRPQLPMKGQTAKVIPPSF